MNQTGERFALAYLYQIEALLAEAQGNIEDSLDHLQNSISTGGWHGGITWQLSATLEFVRLANGGDRGVAAIDALGNVYGQIAIGDCRENMKKARELLEVEENPTK